MTIIGIIYWFNIDNFSFYFGKLPLKVNFIKQIHENLIINH